MLWVDANSELQWSLVSACLLAMASPLGKGIKNDMIRVVQNLREVVRRESGGVRVYFASKLPSAQHGFMWRGGGHSGKILPYQVGKIPSGETLQGQ
jgi:hypothetical protein